VRLAAPALVIAFAAGGCAGDPGRDPGGDEDRCPAGRLSSALDLPDRAIIGAGDPYPADGSLRGREEELSRSQAARRAVGWRIARDVLAPVALAEEVPAELGAVPRFQTWYGREDFQRMFHRLYEQLGPEGRAARAAFGDPAIDDSLGWNTGAVHESESWPLDRYQAYLDAIDEAEEVGGVGGIGRVGYSPGATRHLLASYAETLPCVRGQSPPAFLDGDAPPERRVLRQEIELGACERRELGPFFVAGGEELRATVDGAGAAGLRLLAGPAEAREEVCAVEAGERCEADGPGPITIEVAAGPSGTGGTVTVDLAEAQPVWAACMAGPFPIDAAVVKADWRRSDFGAELAVHDTSADTLARHVADGAVADWAESEAESEGVPTADPGPEDIYTVTVPGGQRYRLAALHIMTKELDHWLWTTLWWSADPDSDFGADRPTSISELDGPWRNYKMCPVAWFTEEDPDPGAAFADSAPSLSAALAAAHPRGGGPSWCSNPYIEEGPGNAATNCIGCHQHGGTGLLSETILDDPRFPAHGRAQVRNNFATDYSWAVDSGDRLGRTVADEVEYYDSFE
jgi:hypothetical protein